MKRIISSMLICCLLAAVLACPAFAAAPVVKLTAGAAQAKPGDTVTITVSAETEEDLYGFQMDVGYDTAVLDFVSAQAQTPDTWYAESLEVSEGNVRLLAYDDTADLSAPVTGTPGIFTLTFQVLEDAPAGNTGIDIKNLLTAGTDGDLIAGATGSGATVEIVGQGGSSEPPETSSEPPETSDEPSTSSQTPGTDKPSIPGGDGNGNGAGNGSGAVTTPAGNSDKPNPGTSDAMILIGSLVVLAGAGGTAVYLTRKRKK